MDNLYMKEATHNHRKQKSCQSDYSSHAIVTYHARIEMKYRFSSKYSAKMALRKKYEESAHSCFEKYTSL